MIGMNIVKNRIDNDDCKSKRIAKVTKGYSIFGFNEFGASQLLFSLSYYYFILYVFFIVCATSCLMTSPTNTKHNTSYKVTLERLLLVGIELRILLGYFYLTLICFVIRRSFINRSVKRRILIKLRIRRPRTPIRNSCLTSLPTALYLWILLINFLLIAISNPSIKNPGPHCEGNFSVFYCNVQGLIPFGELTAENPMLNVTKVHELNHLITNKKPDIVIYNETWLKESIHDSEVLPTDTYKVFRLDRSNYTHPPDPNNNRKFRANGGGVLIGIKHSLDIESKEIAVKCRAEILSIELTDKAGKKSIISSMYRVGTLGADHHDRVSQYLHNIRRRRRVQCLTLIGDLNLPHANWEDNFSPVPIEQSFIDTFNDLSLKQLVTVPTHNRGNVLDNILTDKPDLISDMFVDCSHGPCGSDHFPISFKLKLNARRKKPCKRTIYNFKQANWHNLNEELASKNWEHLFVNHSANESWSIFKEILTNSCDRHIPKISISDEFQPPWFDSEVFHSCRKKERLHKEWKESNDDSKYFKFSRARKNFKDLVDTKMDANFEDPLNRNIINKNFWSYVKSKSNSHRIPEVVSYKDCIRSDPQGQCDIFNTYFFDQFTGDSDYSVEIDYSNDHLFQITFDAAHIEKLLKSLDPNKAQGADNIHGRILKECSVSLSKPLACLFNICYTAGSIPADWKLANVVPVHKKGSKAEVTNYRPISLTSIIMKTFERIVRDDLISRCQHLIDSRQHGFMLEKSCTTQLVSFCDSLAISLNDNVRTDVIYFDFQKAFDSVNHDIILNKLKHQYGIDGSLLKFFKSYLEERHQRVVIGNKMSNPCRVTSGVPQGSILGPTLFILFLNDITRDLSPGTNIAMYADDTKIWRRIKTQDDHWILQRDINALMNWANANKMKFHPSKSHVLPISNANSTTRDEDFIYTISNCPINYTELEKDLGIHIQGKLDWSQHCNKLYSKANQRLGLLKRTCHFTKNISKRRAFYLSQVRSQFEHCTVIWRPSSETMVDKLESLQKRSLKWVLKNLYMSFGDIRVYYRFCKQLDILPLSVRFDLKDILFFHQIFYGISTVSFPAYLNRFTGSRLRHCHLDDLSMVSDTLPKIPQNLTSSNTRIAGISKSFFYRAHILWNNLPYDLRSVISPSIFKIRLRAHLWAKIETVITSTPEENE